MIMCVLLCYPVSIHMSQVQATGRPISSLTTATTSVKVKVLVFKLEVQTLKSDNGFSLTTPVYSPVCTCMCFRL